MARLAACLAALSVPWADGTRALSRPGCQKIINVGQVLRGYTIFKADPLRTQGSDPGFRNARLFKETSLTSWTTGDDCYLVPKGMDVMRENVCTLANLVREVKTAADYEKSARAVANVEGSWPPGSFTASAGYDEFMATSGSEQKTRLEVYAQCEQFVLWHVPGGGPDLTDEFREARDYVEEKIMAGKIAVGVRQREEEQETMFTGGSSSPKQESLLWEEFRNNQMTQARFSIGNMFTDLEDNSTSQENLFTFFDTWGTHYVSAAHLGARFGSVTYLSGRGAKMLGEANSSLKTKVVAQLAGSIGCVGGGLETDRGSKAREDLAKATTVKHQISVGPAPKGVHWSTPKDASPGDHIDALNAWANAAKDDPLPVRYTLRSICDFFKDVATRRQCEDNMLHYCDARLKSWKTSNPHASCGPAAANTAPPATTKEGCSGPPPKCCEGGFPVAGAKADVRVLEFQPLMPKSLSGGRANITAGWETKTCSVPPDSPFGDGDDGDDTRGVKPEGNALRVFVGHKFGRVAEDFFKGLNARNMLRFGWSKSLPKNLYFGLRGTLALKYTPAGGGETFEAIFSDFRVGMGKWFGDRWIGSPKCERSSDSSQASLECVSDEGSRWQFSKGKGGVFIVHRYAQAK